MFTSRAELLDKGETTAEHLKNQREEAERLDKDRANRHPHKGGLFGGLFKPKAPSLKPVVDVDDGVVRCPGCAWELEDGEQCENCGWRYRPDEDRTDYSGTDDLSETDFDSMYDDEAEDGFGGIDDDDSIWGAYGPYLQQNPEAAAAITHFHALLDGAYRPQPWGSFHPMAGSRTDGSEYDEEEDDDYDYMDSFVDDEEIENSEHYDSESDRVTVLDGARPQNPPPLPRGVPSAAPAPYVPISEDEDEDEDSEFDDEEDSVRAPRATWEVPTSSQRDATSSSLTYHDTRSSPACTSEAETNDTEDPPITRSYQWGSIPPEEDDESGSTSSSSPPPRRPARDAGASVRNAITIDDSEDEQPVGPVRRAAQRRRARFSPY